MQSGGPSSPACATTRSPSFPPRANTRSNFAGGFPTSDESGPIPAIHPLNGNACSKVSNFHDRIEEFIRPRVGRYYFRLQSRARPSGSSWDGRKGDEH
jgi:hypothetical protein